MVPEYINLSESNFDAEIRDCNSLFMVLIETEMLQAGHIMSPVIQQLAVKYRESLKVGRLDSKTNPGIMHRYSSFDYYTILLFHSGELVKMFKGLIPLDILEFHIRRYLKGSA